MRRAVLLAIAGFGIATSACSIQTVVRGDLLVTDLGGGAPATYAYEATESHDLTGLAVACGFTWMFYGGACWAFLAAPWDGQEASALEHARDDATRIGRCVDLVGVAVAESRYRSSTPRAFRVMTASGRNLAPNEIDDLCRPKMPIPVAPVAPSPTPEPPPPPPA
jgi:hypothetical protein